MPKNKIQEKEINEEDITIDSDSEFEDLERQIADLGRTYEESGELKPPKVSILRKLKIFRKDRKEKAVKKRIEKLKQRVLEKREKIREKVKIKQIGNLLNKCHELISNSNKAFNNGSEKEAKKLYSKARGIFIKLPHEEKKSLHKELTNLYNKLSK